MSAAAITGHKIWDPLPWRTIAALVLQTKELSSDWCMKILVTFHFIVARHDQQLLKPYSILWLLQQSLGKSSARQASAARLRDFTSEMVLDGLGPFGLSRSAESQNSTSYER